MANYLYLHLENGMTLKGESFGANTDSYGEVVFTTGMTGYVESLTDPSFAGQIVVFTYPLQGNYGVPEYRKLDAHLMANAESEKIWAKGVIVSQNAFIGSHYQSKQSLASWLTDQNIPAILGIDTRNLTITLREHGVLRGKITERPKWPGFKKTDLYDVTQVSVKESMIYTPKKSSKKRVALLDCGVKHGILRALLDTGYTVVRLPYDANPLDQKNIDGVVCSNGPGDPKDWKATIATIEKVVDYGIPFLGICLGHQLLALAIGADTYKLPYGHRGLNQPCQDCLTGKCFLTSQNHGFAVKRDTIPKGYEEWFINLNDKTNEGIIHKTKPIRSVQFHPEGNPGPFDTINLLTFL